MARGLRIAVTVVRVSGVEDFAALEVRWRDLELRAAPSFFQTWTWVGSLAAERFPDPVLVEATEDGRTVALALFNRIRRWVGPAALALGESGSTALDCPYVEQNGVLAEAGREAALTELCLRAVAGRYDVVLAGVGDAVLAAARRSAGLLRVSRSQASPFVDLAAVRAAGGDYLAGRSANTRQQIRRSDRFYAPLQMQLAESVEAGHAMLDEMAVLHQATWTSRSRPGSFAEPFFRRFHRALIGVGLPRGEVALLKFSSNKTVIGILYNFHFCSRMLAYQSGFAYRNGLAQARPGLTCHHRAIRFALDQGADVYDFLAGEDRYKRSLADGSHRQNWLYAGPLWSPALVLRAGLSAVRRLRVPAKVVSADFTDSSPDERGGGPTN